MNANRCLQRGNLAIAAGCVALAFTSGAAAQYFGGNKVRYETPQFEVLPSEHFDIHFYPEEAAAAADTAVLAERWNARLTQLLDHTLSSRQPVILYAGHPQFRQTNATPGEIGEGTGGFTDFYKRRVVIPLGGPARDSDHVLGHELVHAFQFDFMQNAGPGERARGNAAGRLPLWFIEGMAEYLSIGSTDPHTVMWMRDALAHDDLPSISQLDNWRYFPYRWGQALWAYVGGRYGDAAVPRLLRTAIRLGDAQRALEDQLHVKIKQLSDDWHAALRQELGPLVAAAHPVSDYGRALLPARRGRAEFNVSPSLSPDGKRLLFFSARELYSIELYLADAETGEVIRRLTRSATDPHLDSLQFISSSGAWSPDGKRVVIGDVSEGRPMLTILDPETGDTIEEHRFADLVEVIHPAWSPDGKSIAFAANAGGFLQLYLFDLASGTRRQLTHEPYTSMQPAWSPDGTRIAFVTDRFGSDPDQLRFGEIQLAQLDLASGEVKALPGLAGGKNINPQWSPDGFQIYFVSDAGGASNLYRLDLARGTVAQLTDLKTGISGITRLSPTLTVAANAQRIAASVFDDGLYHVYLLENLRPLSIPPFGPPTPSSPPPAGIAVAASPYQLPPRARNEPQVDAVLAAPPMARQDAKVSEPVPYRWRLAPDHAGQPTVAVGASSDGTFGGGLALFWTDMLGDHNLMTQFDLEGPTDTLSRSTTAVVSYDNKKYRWQWGVGIGQLPSLSASFVTSFGTYNGQPARSDAIVRQWQVNREISGGVAYPFTRADRAEVSVGYRHIDFINDAYEEIRSTSTGQLLAAGTIDLPAPPSLDLFPFGTALVHDTSIFGGSAPIAGQRYRVELSAVTGDLSFWSPLLDFRQYYPALKYLSFGGRLMHYGRYGGGAEDPRISPLYIGNPSLVRGYSIYSFDLAECDPAAAPACPAIDQLFGSRIAVGSVEARVPMFGSRALVRSPSVPPIDFALFYDTGVAWSRDDEPKFLGGDRNLVSSYGASLRLGFGGILALQWNYVHPLDRPLRDWVWEFWITPAF